MSRLLHRWDPLRPVQYECAWDERCHDWWTSILPCMCHFGLEGVSKAENHLLRFYGLGAGETPAEQSSGGRLGIWTVDTEIAVTPYVNPQACRYAVAGVRRWW